MPVKPRWKRMVLYITGGLAATLLFLVSCGPDTGLNAVEDFDVVVTLYDQSIDFKDYATFSIPDSVVHLKIPGVDVTDNITWVYHQHMLNKITSLLEVRGYEKVDPHPGKDGRDDSPGRHVGERRPGKAHLRVSNPPQRGLILRGPGGCMALQAVRGRGNRHILYK